MERHVVSLSGSGNLAVVTPTTAKLHFVPLDRATPILFVVILLN